MMTFFQGLELIELRRKIGKFGERKGPTKDENVSHMLSNIFLRASRILWLEVINVNQRVLEIIQKAMRKDILVEEFIFNTLYLDCGMRYITKDCCFITLFPGR